MAYKITFDEVYDAFRYTSDEEAFINTLIDASQAFMEISGTYKPSTPLCKMVQMQLIGFWLEHRESVYTNYTRVGDFPLTIQGLLNQLYYYVETESGALNG